MRSSTTDSSPGGEECCPAQENERAKRPELAKRDDSDASLFSTALPFIPVDNVASLVEVLSCVLKAS
jgi:hypothetical protein